MVAITKNTGEEIRIERTEYKGLPLVDIRVWRKNYKKTMENGGYSRTAKGLTVRPEVAVELGDAIKKVLESSFSAQ
jgi:hypothetical protein